MCQIFGDSFIFIVLKVNLSYFENIKYFYALNRKSLTFKCYNLSVNGNVSWKCFVQSVIDMTLRKTIQWSCLTLNKNAKRIGHARSKASKRSWRIIAACWYIICIIINLFKLCFFYKNSNKIKSKIKLKKNEIK